MTLSSADFEILLQANKILSSQLDINIVLKNVLELASQVVHAEASSLLLLDEGTQELYFDVVIGEAGQSVKKIRLKMGEGVAGWAAQERKTVIVNDVSKDPRFSGKADQSTQFRTQSILAVPLIAQGRLVGVIEAINKKSGQKFETSDVEAFELFSSQAAIAIQNARLFQVLNQEREKLNTVFAEMSEGIILLDSKKNIVLINPIAEKFLDIKANVVLGKELKRELFPHFEWQISGHESELFNRKVSEIELIRREGKYFCLQASLWSLKDDNNPVQTGYLVILKDQTEKKRGDALKQNFLSLISHKFKTPLTVILGYVPLLASMEKDVNPMIQKALSAVGKQAEQLNSLVDKLLRFTTVESDAIKPKMVDLAVVGVVKKTIDLMDEFLNQNKASVLFDEFNLNVPVFADITLFTDVLKNVIENGVKFNTKEEKMVKITASPLSDGVLVKIKDNGPGIPPEEIGKLFEKFYQVENSFTGQVPGAGLGLALCKKMMTLMNGEITITSKLGEGSVVELKFPFK
ncbi:MAG: ATP-binding protein [Elusimicrobiota bacterium]